MKNITKFFLLFITTVFICSCDDEQFSPSLNHISFGSQTYSTGVDVGANTTIDVEVFTSEIVNSDIIFNVAVDGKGAADGSYTVPPTVTVPGGSNKGIITIGLSDVDLGIGVNKLVLSFTDVETGYGNGEATTVEYIQNCEEVTVTLDLVFHDRWPEEAGWEITDSLGGVVASAPTGTYAGQTSATESITLCGGRSFTFKLTDGYADGGHTYTIKLGDVVKASHGSPYSYTSEISSSFDTN